MPQSINPNDILKPPFRKLRGYAFDPSLSLKIDTVSINNIVYKVLWEDNLEPGPVGEYLEVIDYDPTVNKFYAPVNLNNHYILAQDGLNPSESNPQFHQQMVYSVAMTTINNFEKALGRKVIWSERITEQPETDNQTEAETKKSKPKKTYDYTPKLRIYPHAFREANAFYSPQKKALLFGYFSAHPAEVTVTMPNALVFTCLSHDIIAHETTHAILDGMFRNYTESSNPDVLAFHEAFADIVALFQHFTFPEVLKNQIAKTKGDLNCQNLLGQLAQEFGLAIGNYGALRDAIGSFDNKTKKWTPKEPDGDEYIKIMKPHSRGSILVSAVFEAFITIYKNRIADLLRIASNGSGILPQGELHPDLVNRLADEAAKTAGQILRMCVRALDYCPPVDINFGNYLRAIITADTDLVAEDDRDYRLAFIDAFRRRGIYPTGIKTLSVESLTYPEPKIKGLEKIDLSNIEQNFEKNKNPEVKNKEIVSPELKDVLINLIHFLRDFRTEIIYAKEREDIYNKTREFIAGNYNDKSNIKGGFYKSLKTNLVNLQEFEILTGLVFNKKWTELGIKTSMSYKVESPSFEIQTLKLASRVGPNGNQLNQIILTLIQKAGIKQVLKDENGDLRAETFDMNQEEIPEKGFIMQGGCTLIFDLDTLQLKYAISKPILDVEFLKKTGKYQIDAQRASRVNPFAEKNHTQSLYDDYFNPSKKHSANEPFSFLHTH